ncbi:SIS domain-containing protein [Miniphocaeibacter halophilus]|uniref:SIS domain-containing protein n=1 Tax=Miniphocaeibacter halophilus TaxID=2931922 RepID=A0AC61MRR9_9FIRM|nr:SIS domain-containing protein [Miniphocaeibacter halophilus]QQK07008.1 SIS domain-containing protein [Miniphocaeibacter halophilus]
MFNLEKKVLEDLGAVITVEEVAQQPDLWLETLEIYNKNKEGIEKFIDKVSEGKEKVRIIFTGAGTSAYVGDIAAKHLLLKKNRNLVFESIPTTDIVSNPYLFFNKDETTVLVSFARSGNSPESIKAVDLANQLVDDIYHLAITCAKEGKLSQDLKDKDNAFVLLMPDKSNDKGFAMTGSFTCMLLSSILIFDNDLSEEEKKNNVELITKLGKNVVERDEEIQQFVDLDFNRVVYLGSGVFTPLTREAQLKILELTAGQIVTCFDSSMGFRHGPKSFVNEKTLVFDFVSTNEYTRKYDVDILNEIFENNIAVGTIAITKDNLNEDFKEFSLNENTNIEDIFLVFPYIMVAQTIAIMASLKVNNKPDTPSATGTVNRVVKGVIIHSYE